MGKKILDWIFIIFVAVFGVFGTIKSSSFLCGFIAGMMYTIGITDLISDYKEDKK